MGLFSRLFGRTAYSNPIPTGGTYRRVFAFRRPSKSDAAEYRINIPKALRPMGRKAALRVMRREAA